MQVGEDLVASKTSAEVNETLRRIYEALFRKGWTQAELAARLEKSPAWMSATMNGKHSITLQTLHDIAEALGVTTASLIPVTKDQRVSFEDYIKGIVAEAIEEKLGRKGGNE